MWTEKPFDIQSLPAMWGASELTDLASIIRSIESGGNQNAIRFELAAFRDWAWVISMDRIRGKHGCSKDTARMIACTSWGLYQMMGANIFDPRFPKDPLTPVDPDDVITFVNDPHMQDTLFYAFLRAHSINFTLEDLLNDDMKMTTFVTRWNGPGNVTGYSELIREHAKLA